MDLPPDKAKLLKQYDNEKKWDIICDQVSIHVLSCRELNGPGPSPARLLFLPRFLRGVVRVLCMYNVYTYIRILACTLIPRLYPPEQSRSCALTCAYLFRWLLSTQRANQNRIRLASHCRGQKERKEWEWRWIYDRETIRHLKTCFASPFLSLIHTRLYSLLLCCLILLVILHALIQLV